MQLHPEDTQLDIARAWLRELQERAVNTVLQGSNRPLVTDAALVALDQIVRFTPTKDQNLVRRGVFKYRRESEISRIARAKSIICHVAPGPFEDPIYFAILAYQAASVEMAYEGLYQKRPIPVDFSKFLLGTLHFPLVNAFADKITKTPYTIVVIFSALIDFFYQAAKAVVEAVNPLMSTDPRSSVVVNFDPEVIRTRLDSDSRSAERLYQTLRGYFVDGKARASAGEIIPQEHYPVLSLLVGMAERWTIAHEYGHGLAPSFERVPPTVNPVRTEEYFADRHATIATVFSAASLDSVPPEIPLGGAIFTLACLDILQKSRSILQTGKETSSDAEQGTHPEPVSRAAEVINCFRQFFDVHYYPDKGFDLKLLLRKEVPKTHEFSREHSERAYKYANVLWILWKPVKERLLENRHNMQLHPVWRL
ncbi:MAG: hypothetical protein H8K03_12085 [Nitrospira sp.]